MATTRKRMVRTGVYGTLGVILLIILAHPFSRQSKSMFGPQIRGLPLCYWQDGFRRRAQGDQGPDLFTTKVVRWLGLDTREQVVFLVLTLADDPQPRVREGVADVLGWGFAPEQCMPALIRMLDDREASVRAAAAKSLARMHPEATEAFPRLIELLEDPDIICRRHAAHAVWQLGKKKPREVVTIFRQALSDPDYLTRVAAAGWLGEMETDAADALPDLAEHALGETNLHVRLAATMALGRLGLPAIPVLTKLLRDWDRDIRSTAAHGLGRIGPAAKESVQDIQPLLNDRDAYVRKAATDALHRIDPERFPAPRAERE
jgi:HEAT repeat protein